MKGKLQVINMVLGGLGEATVSAEAESKFSRLAAAFYDAVLEETLRAHPWNFADNRKQLAHDSTPPIAGYANAFPLPSDCLRVMDCGDLVDYSVNGRAIHCDETTVILHYIARVEDATQWDALFTSALVANLMWKITYPITKSTTLRDSNAQMYSQLLQQARSVDAQEQPAEEFEESVFIRARG